MKSIFTHLSVFRWLLVLALAGCSAPAALPVVQTVVQTVVVVVTVNAPEQPTSASPTETSTGTDVSTATPAPTATPLPQPSPTALSLVNIPIEGGDPNNMFFAHLVFPDYEPAATTSLTFQVLAHNPMSSKKDGEGINSVEFTIQDPDGNQVYDQVEKNAPYCAFSDDGKTCNVFDFAKNNFQWPNNGGQIVSGRYTIRVEALSGSADMNGSAYFLIQVP